MICYWASVPVCIELTVSDFVHNVDELCVYISEFYIFVTSDKFSIRVNLRFIEIDICFLFYFGTPNFPFYRHRYFFNYVSYFQIHIRVF